MSINSFPISIKYTVSCIIYDYALDVFNRGPLLVCNVKRRSLTFPNVTA